MMRALYDGNQLKDVSQAWRTQFAIKDFVVHSPLYPRKAFKFVGNCPPLALEVEVVSIGPDRYLKYAACSRETPEYITILSCGDWFCIPYEVCCPTDMLYSNKGLAFGGEIPSCFGIITGASVPYLKHGDHIDHFMVIRFQMEMRGPITSFGVGCADEFRTSLTFEPKYALGGCDGGGW